MKSVSEETSQIVTKQEGEELIDRMEAGGKVSEEYIEEFKRAFLKKTFVVLTLAFKPNAPFVTKLKSWFCQNMGEDVLLDLKIDEKIVGGVVLICNNHYKDYSLASTVDKYLK